MSDLSAAQERAVRLALQAGRYRRRAEAAEATVGRVRALHERWQATGSLAAGELGRVLDGPVDNSLGI